MSRTLLRARAARRFSKAMTLVEILVATGGMVVVMLIAYQIYDETQRASLKMLHRQAAADYSVSAMDEIASAIRGAVAPSDLANPDAAPASFQPDQFTVPGYPNLAEGGLYTVNIRAVQGEGGAFVLERRDTPVASATGRAAVAEKSRPLGGKVENFAPKVSFRYAVSAAPDKKVEYTDSLPAGQWPALIEVTVGAELKESPTQPVVLQTSLIPGRLPKGEAAVPASQPAAAPAPAAQPAAPPVAEPNSNPAPAPPAQP